jgi:hypothetical protein
MAQGFKEKHVVPYVQEMALCVKQKPSKRSFDMNA